MPSCELQREDPAPLKVIIRFELPVPIRVEKLPATGFGLSRSAVRGMVDSGRIRLPMAMDAKAREDFTVFVIATHRRHAMQQRITRHPHTPAGDRIGVEPTAATAPLLAGRHCT